MAKSYDLGAVTAYATAVEHGYEGTEEQFAAEMTGAAQAAREAAQDASDAEAYAVGKRNGTDVPSTDPTYQNNAKYWAEHASGANLAQDFSISTDYGIDDYVLYNNKLYRFTVAHTAGAWNSSHVVEVKTMNELSDLKDDLNDVVKVTTQTLTEAQKAQARTNIGAVGSSDLPSGIVRYDIAQSLTDAQKIQVKSNIGITDGNRLDGLSNEVKTALLRCIRNVGWAITDGVSFYNLLDVALNRSYPRLVVEYVPSTTVYSYDSLNKLKNDLTVTYYNDSSSPGLIVTEYELSGNLSEKYSLISVSYGSVSTFFEVYVEMPLFEYKSSSGKKLSEIEGVVSSYNGSGMIESIVDGHLRYYVPASSNSIYLRRDFPVGFMSSGRIRIKFQGISIPRAVGINAMGVRISNGTKGAYFGLSSDNNWETKIVYGQEGNTITDDSIFTRGDWHVFESTFDENGQKIFVDNTMVVESNLLSEYYTTSNTLFAINGSNQRAVEFYIDEIQIFGTEI